MRKSVSVLALSLILAGFSVAATPTSALVVNGKLDEPTYQSLNRSLPLTERRINAADKERTGLIAAVRARDITQVRAALIRNGVSARDLEGLEIRVQDLSKHSEAKSTTNDCFMDIIRIRLIDHIYLVVSIN